MRLISRLPRSASRLIAAACCASLLVSGLAAPAPALADVTFRINGGGFGHGIGLSQYGAKGYAEQGWGYQDIVRYYYGGVRDYAASDTKVRTLESLGNFSNPTVKVNIDSGVGKSGSISTRTSWTLRSWNSKLAVRNSAGTTVLPTQDGYYTFALDSATGKIKVGGRLYSGTLSVSSVSTAGVSPSLVVVGSTSGPFDRTNVRYRREIQLTVVDVQEGNAFVKRLRAVNALPIEEYLYGVVPRESPSSWHAEALKAQAVAARSYAWASNKPTSAGSSSLNGFLACTTWDQVYGGHSKVIRSNGADVGIDTYETANAAVNATAGRVAYHAPTQKVIQTFFSSSSGGHTANIEDVWTGSSPAPYYKGVRDADQASADYRWPTRYATGAELAQAIRAKDDNVGGLDYSAAYPATVIGVSHERASSGYVRNAVVRWSNGKSFTLSGTLVQSILGLKSSKFTILGPTWSGLIQETDSKMTWTGAWSTWKYPLHSGGAYKYSWQQGAKSTFAFSGTGFRWYALKWPKGGKADVYLDGTRLGTVSLYSPTRKYHQVAYEKTGLSINTTHTVTIEVLRTKDASSTGYCAGVDALRVQSGTLIPLAP